MTLRKITSHKGGRSAVLNIRITPEALEALREMASKFGMSQADIIEALLIPERSPIK